MKKIVITLITSVLVSIAAFAGNEVETAVDSAFYKRFGNAENVTWAHDSSVYKASFKYDGKWMFAFYDSTAKLIGTSRYISPTQLPSSLQRKIKQEYAMYWISDLFEVSDDNGTEYYITLQQGETKIMLVSKEGKKWRSYCRGNNEIVNSLT